jgi:hypothetical protein
VKESRERIKSAQTHHVEVLHARGAYVYFHFHNIGVNYTEALSVLKSIVRQDVKASRV